MITIARVKYDVSKAEVRNFEVPKPGVYEAHIHEMSHGDSSSGNPMFTIVFEITKGEHKGSRIWYYILTDGSQEWRLREFTDALGLKTKGELDTDKLTGTVVQIKTAIEPAREGYDEKARIKNVLPAAGTASGGDDEEDEAPYSEWSQEDLKEEFDARQLTIKGRATKKKLIDALEANDEENEGKDDEEEEEGDDEEEEDEDSITRADLDEMSRTELKKLIGEEELDIKILKKHTDDDIREKIAEALELEEDEDEDEEEEGDEEEDDDESEEDTNYEEWSISELKTELKERSLKTDGRKSALVKRLKADDASNDEPF